MEYTLILASLMSQFISWFKWSGLSIFLILVGSFIIYRLITGGVWRTVRLLKKDPRLTSAQLAQRVQTLGSILQGLVRFVIFLAAALMILKRLGVDITPILASVGVAGLAVGFGAQHIVRDLIAGFFILFDDRFSVGDLVIIDGVKGTVEDMNLRLTQLRTEEGGLYTIPNGQIKAVTNLSRGWGLAQVNLSFSPTEDLDKVIETARKVCAKVSREAGLNRKIIGQVKVLAVEGLNSTGIKIKLTAKTEPVSESDVAREIRKLCKLEFEKEGIALQAIE
jgi:small conductance mechanosensitive channel